ncbi:sigma factor-like helix-turn-helix DNA-binding protein [Pseudogemmobacter sonorensis]|uniref:sigma factor-like helix-turn-helix DNA-binding protein n=1 Tax=Pseudogemmobacter sonorensis TaxID=2989681 RepID=UPI0036B9E7E2
MAKPAIRDVPRARDIEILDQIQRRCRGESAYAIARAAGVDGANLNSLMRKVLADDLKYSGEPEEVVRAGYWPGA